MYAEDSLFTLSLPGQLGVVAIALLLSSGLIWVAWRSKGQLSNNILNPLSIYLRVQRAGIELTD